MNLIRTKSFKLAVYIKGSPDSSRLAIVIPGRLDTKDYVHNTSLVDHLASLGFLAVSFDPPGIWESPGRIELYTTTNYLKAIEELIEYYGNKPTVLLGHSRGGSVAILASSHPDVLGIVAIMASYGPPTPPREETLETGFQISHRDLPPGDVHTDIQKTFQLPIGYFSDGEKYNAGEVLQKLAKPKLLIYGLQDEFSGPEDLKELEAAPDPKTIYSVDSEHDYRHYPKVIEEVNREIGDFVLSQFGETR